MGSQMSMKIRFGKINKYCIYSKISIDSDDLYSICYLRLTFWYLFLMLELKSFKLIQSSSLQSHNDLGFGSISIMTKTKFKCLMQCCTILIKWNYKKYWNYYLAKRKMRYTYDRNLEHLSHQIDRSAGSSTKQSPFATSWSSQFLTKWVLYSRLFVMTFFPTQKT